MLQHWPRVLTHLWAVKFIQILFHYPMDHQGQLLLVPFPLLKKTCMVHLCFLSLLQMQYFTSSGHIILVISNGPCHLAIGLLVDIGRHIFPLALILCSLPSGHSKTSASAGPFQGSGGFLPDKILSDHTSVIHRK